MEETGHDQSDRTEGSLQADLYLHELQVRPRLPLRQIRPGGEVLEMQFRRNGDAVAHLEPNDIVKLTEQAARATFYTDGLTAEQIKANERIPQMSGQAVAEAASAEHQHLAVAFEAGQPAGFMIATRHGPNNLELDWLMVHPRRHGSGLAASLMTEGIGWLGADQSIWLTVIRHNERAIRFYRKFGFEIDKAAELNRQVPTWIMRREPAAPRPLDPRLPSWRGAFSPRPKRSMGKRP